MDRLHESESVSAQVLATLAVDGNDLEAPAIALVSVIADVLAALAALPGCRLARMSGSGATCFGLFDLGPTLQRRACCAAHTPVGGLRATAAPRHNCEAVRVLGHRARGGHTTRSQVAG